MRLLHGLILSGLILTGQIWGKHWHESRDQWNWQSQHADDTGPRNGRHDKDCYFPPHDVRLISEYYPPRYRPRIHSGLEKKFRRNGQLPTGWEVSLQLLPEEVDCLLVPIPTQYRRGILDGFAVVYSPQSGVIIDATSLFGSRPEKHGVRQGPISPDGRHTTGPRNPWKPLLPTVQRRRWF